MRNGSVINEFRISDGVYTRQAVTGLQAANSPYPFVTYYPSQVFGITFYFTVADYSGIDYQLYEINLGQLSVPTITSPKGTAVAPAYTSSQTPALQWSYSDADGDAQKAYQIEVYNNSTGALVCTTNRVNSTASSWTYSGATLNWFTTYKWRIKTWDALEGESAWSDYSYFIPNRAPTTPGITAPRGTSTVPVLVPTLTPVMQWTFADPDPGDTPTAYQIEVYNNAGTLVHNTGKVTSTALSWTYNGTALTWNTIYKWRVKTWDIASMEGVWSDYNFFRTNRPPTATNITGASSVDFPIGLGKTPRLHFQYSDPEVDTLKSFNIKIFRASDNVVVVNKSVTTNQSYYDVIVTELQADTIYGWQVQPTDIMGYQATAFSTPTYFYTNMLPETPILLSPPDNIRTNTKPTFEASINNDLEADYQHFKLQLAEDDQFTVGVHNYDTSIQKTGWEVYDGSKWVAFPTGGVRRVKQLVVDPSFELGSMEWAKLWDYMEEPAANDAIDTKATPLTGKRALRIVNNSGTSGLGVQHILAGWKPGDRLKVTAKVFAVRVGTQARINIDVLGENYDPEGIVITSPTTKYETYSFEAPLPAMDLNNLSVRIFVDGGNPANTEFWVDDITVEVIQPATYEKVRFTPQNDLIEGKTYYWRIAPIDGYTGTLGYYTDKRVLTNLFGSAGNLESFTNNTFAGFDHHYDVGAATLQKSTTDFLYGSASAKLVNTIADNYARLARQVTLTRGKYYLFMADVKSDVADVTINVASFFGKPLGKTNMWQTIYTKCPGVGRKDWAVIYANNTAEQQTTYIDGIRFYEISKEEYDRIDVDPDWTGDNLAMKYPYVDNTKTIPTPRTIRVGDLISTELKEPVPTSAAAEKLVLNVGRVLPTEARTIKRVEDRDQAITYTGTWQNNGNGSNGSWTFNVDGNGSAELTFVGTGIRWYGYKDPEAGIANIYIDDIFIGQVDQYGEPTDTNYHMNFEKLDLPYGQHKIKIAATKFFNPDSYAYTCALIDHFEVITDETPATFKVEACNNAYDETPTWEDVTYAVLNGGYHLFSNKSKTAENWGINLRITVTANGTYSPIEIDGFGLAYE
ncbi:hypothetical protein [Brevibacillus dissolubilis]|uniref:glycoside hydrolase family 78 protein n=1 Tax=Brevibacillus dissolubilis TaxID=1844116 RepID=UPI0011172195|nr:hypothetical protein [Brevibacillus dissolubilis]